MTSSNSQILQKTILNPVHKAAGGNMVNFGGWEMPLWYSSGAIKEHLAVIEAAGLFDTSHMSVIVAQSPNSGAVKTFLNYALSKDISELQIGRAGYSTILNDKAHTIDDTIVYPLAENRIALVVNAGMGQAVIDHMQGLAKANKDWETITWQDLSGKIAKLDIQGPNSFKILKPFVANRETVFAKFPYFSFQGDFDFTKSQVHLTDGTPILLSRTGYTGELGFEIFLPLQGAEKLWHDLLATAGGANGSGLIACGLAARDSLRAGAVLPLSHQDIGPWPFINTPWPWPLPFNEDGKFSKNFVGSAALEKIIDDIVNGRPSEHTLVFVGYDPRKVETEEAKVVYNGQDIGVVLTAVADMAIGRVKAETSGFNQDQILSLASPQKPEGWSPRGLVCGFIKVNKALEPGTIVELKDERRSIKVEICRDIRPNRTARKALSA